MLAAALIPVVGFEVAGKAFKPACNPPLVVVVFVDSSTFIPDPGNADVY